MHGQRVLLGYVHTRHISWPKRINEIHLLLIKIFHGPIKIRVFFDCVDPSVVRRVRLYVFHYRMFQNRSHRAAVVALREDRY